MDFALIGAMAGGALGIAGGAAGTYFSIKNTDGPRERRFMIRVAVAGWAAITAFLALLYFTPEPYRWLLWLPYGILLAAGILWCNRRQAAIRIEEHSAS
jgi:hypothetical protein